MSKVTNNENMRRYVHMKLSNGGSGSDSGSGCNCEGTLIIECSFENNNLVPEQGEPTFADAVDAFKAGRRVMLYYETADESYYYPLLCYEKWEGRDAFTYLSDDEVCHWSNPGSNPGTL